jgi:5-formyltetrahydrofolate cyclo-ligase
MQEINDIIRRHNLYKRKNLSKIFNIKKSYRILTLLKKIIKPCKHIASYYAVEGELATLLINRYILKSRQKLYLPVISDDKLEFCRTNLSTEWQKNKFNIPEPIGKKQDIKNLDIILVPLVAFDNKANRLGFGGGFYDKTLGEIKKENRPLLVGLAHAFQYSRHITTHRHDITLDYIVTN